MNKIFEKQALAVLDQLSNASGRTVDTLYASLVHRLGITQPFFTAGWGDLQVVDFNEGAELLHHWPPPHFDVQISWRKLKEGVKEGHSYELLEGTFRTPCQGRVFDALPQESRTTHLQLLAPKDVGSQTSCVVHLAGTGDHGFHRRIRLGAPLLSKGIATMVLESPYYGRRRPEWQEGSRLLRVSDLLVLGRATIEESLCLLEWAQRQGYRKLGMCGFSMGGVHASMVASLFPAPVACTPLLAPRSASVAFCDGALWDATAWKPLISREDEKHKDIMATLHAAAQPSLLTAAAIRVLRNMASDSATPAWKEQTPPQQQGPPEAAGLASEKILHRSQAGVQQRTKEAAEVAVQELQSPQQRSRSDTGPAITDGVAAEAASASTSYSSAAAFLGFRLPGWKATERRDGSGGIGQAERQLSSLWTDKSRLAQQEARKRLEQVLETYTDVTRFPSPKQPSAAVIVGALEDAYVTRESIRELASHWPGSEVRWVPGGHVSAFLLQQPAFRSAIVDSLERLDLKSA